MMSLDIGSLVIVLLRLPKLRFPIGASDRESQWPSGPVAVHRAGSLLLHRASAANWHVFLLRLNSLFLAWGSALSYDVCP
jgi:hypothetical protein